MSVRLGALVRSGAAGDRKGLNGVTSDPFFTVRCPRKSQPKTDLLKTLLPRSEDQFIIVAPRVAMAADL